MALLHNLCCMAYLTDHTHRLHPFDRRSE